MGKLLHMNDNAVILLMVGHLGNILCTFDMFVKASTAYRKDGLLKR